MKRKKQRKIICKLLVRRNLQNKIQQLDYTPLLPMLHPRVNLNMTKLIKLTWLKCLCKIIVSKETSVYCCGLNKLILFDLSSFLRSLVLRGVGWVLSLGRSVTQIIKPYTFIKNFLYID